MSKEKFLAAVAIGIGMWGFLSKELVGAYFSLVGQKLISKESNVRLCMICAILVK